MNKITKPAKPVILTLTHEGKKYNLKLHAPGSNENYFASIKYTQALNAISGKDPAQAIEAMGILCGELIIGWAAKDNTFYGGEFSQHYAIEICSQVVNNWLVKAITEKVITPTKKSIKPLKN